MVIRAVGELDYGYAPMLRQELTELWRTDTDAAPSSSLVLDLTGLTFCDSTGLAARVGLAVPQTIVTSDPQAAHTWAKELRRAIVYKPPNGVWHADEGRIRALYTSPVTDLESLLNPALAGPSTCSSLLSWWAGHDGVTSIEVDPEVAAQAAANIAAAGFTPHLVIGDGLKGCPHRAPFDRVHVTAGVFDIPMAWIEQTRPGGVIVLPWQPGGATGHKLRLTVIDENTAVGTFHGRANYMMVRSQRHGSMWNAHHSTGLTASLPSSLHGDPA